VGGSTTVRFVRTARTRRRISSLAVLSVRGHVEKQEVALLGAQDAFVDEAFGEALADLLELVADFHEVPGFACGFGC
jgi:hypothetical protein